MADLGLVRSIVVHRIVASCTLTLALAACATEHTVTGKVVDPCGRPVEQALITVTFRAPQDAGRDRERLIWQTTMTAHDGTFSFTTKERVADLALEADSPDLRKVALLPHIQPSGNLLVVR